MKKVENSDTSIILDYLDTWDKHIHDSKELGLAQVPDMSWVTSRLIHNKMQAIKISDYEIYESLSHLLQYMPSSIFGVFKSREEILALKVLQVDNFLSSRERPPPHYNSKACKNKKHKTEKNQESCGMFIRR